MDSTTGVKWSKSMHNGKEGTIKVVGFGLLVPIKVHGPA